MFTQFCKFTRRAFAITLASLALLACGQLSAQTAGQPVEQMAISELQAQANSLVDAGRFVAARPFLIEIAKRYAGGTAEERALVGDYYFFVAVSHLQSFQRDMKPEDLTQAVEFFTKVEQHNPSEERLIQLLEFRGDSFRGLGKFDEAVADFARLLSDPLDRRLRPAKRLEILEKISLAFQGNRDWQKGEPFLRRFLELADDDRRRSLAAGLLLEAYIDLDRTAAILELLPLITVDGPQRYSASLNVALMRAGDRLADRGRFAEAALLYNATLSLDQIVAFFDNRVTEMTAEIERQRAMGRSEERLGEAVLELELTRRQLAALKEVESYTPQLRARTARNLFLAGRDHEALWAYLRFVREFPDNPMAKDFEFAAFTTASRLGVETLARELGERILAQDSSPEFRKTVLLSMAVAYSDAKDERLLKDVVESFLAESREDAMAGQMIFLVGNLLVAENKTDELIDWLNSIWSRMEGTPSEDTMLYWRGMAQLFEMNFAKAREDFSRLVSAFPRSVYREDATFRIAMTYYGDDMIEEAQAAFNSMIEQFPDNPLRGEALFFLGEIAASQGRILQAVNYYTEVSRHTRNMAYITSAMFQKVRVLERNNAIERAARTLEEYISEFGDEGALTQAIFELGRLRESQGRPGEAMASFLQAIRNHAGDFENTGVDLIIAEYFRRHREVRERIESSLALLQRLDQDEAFRQRLASSRAFLYQQFADNPALDPVLYEELRLSDEFSKALAESAEPIQPLLERYRRQRQVFPAASPAEEFRRMFAAAVRRQDRVTALRMQKALDEMGQPRPPGALIVEASDLDRSSPAVLVWIGRTERRLGSDLAALAFQRVIDFDDFIPAKVDAFLELGSLRLEEGDIDEALQLFARAEEEFPADPRIYVALIEQGQILSNRGRFDEAREKFLGVLRTPDWRGEPHAQALFRMGETLFEEGRFAEAHGFFERTFLGYAFYADWAARAYLMDGRTLISMGHANDARRTLEEAMGIEAIRRTPFYNDIVQLHATL